MSDEMKAVFTKLGCLALAEECQTIDPNTKDPVLRAKLNQMMKILIDNHLVFNVNVSTSM